ncbi:Angiotensin II, type I receptor-associated protein-like protein [Sarcoptes scabiei]|uniref:Angiotensin II, type I receptor-associated protein-like protein n=1 Tax=Sarcoptes scabiei TaxID=52283 RepID=A0A132A1D2_SARSC|nr:Angiotensin II, type I receptor-associated protein-like protein [Sarcoptes scabiei]
MDPFTAFNQSPLKGTFFIHFVLITSSMLTLNWLPEIFFFYNLFFFLSIFWALHSLDDPNPVQLASILNLSAVLFDIVAITSNYNDNHYRHGFAFSIFLLIVNTLARPFTSFFLLKIYGDREMNQTIYGGDPNRRFDRTTGMVNPIHEQFHSNRSNNGYQNLDHNEPIIMVPGNTVSTTPYKPYDSAPEQTSNTNDQRK